MQEGREGLSRRGGLIQHGSRASSHCGGSQERGQVCGGVAHGLQGTADQGAVGKTLQKIQRPLAGQHALLKRLNCWRGCICQRLHLRRGAKATCQS